MIKTALFPWILVVFLFYFITPPIIRSWNWKEDELKLFDLVKEMEKTNENFYKRLGVESSANIKEISKAYRQLVIKQHPEITDGIQFKVNSEIAYILRTPKLKALYDSTLTISGHHQLPRWKGFYYMYIRHKIPCMILVSLACVSLMEYIKAWNNYWTERVVIEQFIKNAKIMAQKISDKHLSATTHKSYLDLDNKTIQCEITKEREILVINEKGERMPLDVSALLKKPNLYSLSILKFFFNVYSLKKKN